MLYKVVLMILQSKYTEGQTCDLRDACNTATIGTQTGPQHAGTDMRLTST